MAKVQDVAALSGLSTSTVSPYLNKNGYVSKKAAAKIEKAIAELDFRPSFLGRSLKYNRSFIIAICVPMVSHPFFAKMIQAVENEAYRMGYKLLVTDSDNKREREEDFIELVLNKRVDGIIFVTHNKYETFDDSLPVVTIDRSFGPKVPCVTSDNYDAVYAGLAYLYNKGRRHIGFIGGRPNVQSEVLERYKAYQDFIRDKGLDDLSFYVDSRHGEELGNAYKFITKYQHLDAIVTSSDAYGFACYRALGYDSSATRKVDIITYDGIMNDWIQYPTFTAIKQNIDEMAKAVVDVLIKQMNKEPVKSKYIVKTEFIKGETA
ncbi:MAG TPA: LacI family DNA-binding transcriptional regulator [Bacilli bacterium]|nr:LacI family DNA-binding transcriptional regulator [Bacilli bacterium]